MILFYAVGGGFGHLRRVERVIGLFGIAEFKIVSNNPVAMKIFGADRVILLLGDSAEAWSTAMRDVISSLLPNEIYIDTFPAGLLGELTGEMMRNRRVHYLARRLKWNQYSPLLPQHVELHFQNVYTFEALEAPHLHFIYDHSTSVRTVTFQDTPIHTETKPASLPNKEIWLVVHTFHRDEVESLLDDAIDVAVREKKSTAIVLLSDIPIDRQNVIQTTDYSLTELLPFAERIFCGGGYNTLLEVRHHRSKVRAVPFPRKFDDQAWRIREFYAGNWPEQPTPTLVS